MGMYLKRVIGEYNKSLLVSQSIQLNIMVLRKKRNKKGEEYARFIMMQSLKILCDLNKYHFMGLEFGPNLD